MGHAEFRIVSNANMRYYIDYKHYKHFMNARNEIL